MTDVLELALEVLRSPNSEAATISIANEIVADKLKAGRNPKALAALRIVPENEITEGQFAFCFSRPKNNQPHECYWPPLGSTSRIVKVHKTYFQQVPTYDDAGQLQANRGARADIDLVSVPEGRPSPRSFQANAFIVVESLEIAQFVLELATVLNNPPVEKV